METIKKPENSIKTKAQAIGAKVPWLGYSAVFFLFLCLYNYYVILSGNFRNVTSIVYTYHLVDFKLGFCSKILPGALFNLFFKQPTIKNVTVFETVLLLVSFAALAFLTAKVVTSARDKKTRRALTVIAFFFFAGPCSFCVYVWDLGSLNSYWFYLALIFMFFVENKYLKFVAPVLLFLMMMVHYAVIISYVAFACMILLYKAACAEDKKEKKTFIAIIAVSAAASLAALFYFLKYDSVNVKLPLEEFRAELVKRAGPHGEYANPDYYDMAFFRDYVTSSVEIGRHYGYTGEGLIPTISWNLPAPILSLINLIYSQVYIAFNIEGSVVEKAFKAPYVIALCLPLIVFIYSFWIKMIKTESSKLKKFSYFLGMAHYPFCVIIGLLNSTDIMRWFAPAFIILTAYFFYAVYKEDKAKEIVRGKALSLDWRLVASYYFVYAVTALVSFS